MAFTSVPDIAAVSIFDSQVPPELLREIGRLVLVCYPEAEDRCEDIAGFEEIHDLRAHLRRALVETSLASLQGRYDGTVVRTPSNATRSAYHKEIVSGSVVMTISSVPNRGSQLPEARFRQTLARYNQTTIFDPEPVLGDGAPLWAAIIHGPTPISYRVPSFIRVVFPYEDGTHVGGIDILARFPDLLTIPALEKLVAADRRSDAAEPVAPAKIEEPMPTIRPGVVKTDEDQVE